MELDHADPDRSAVAGKGIVLWRSLSRVGPMATQASRGAPWPIAAGRYRYEGLGAVVMDGMLGAGDALAGNL